MNDDTKNNLAKFRAIANAMPKSPAIYKFTSFDGLDSYVGATRNLRRRLSVHTYHFSSRRATTKLLAAWDRGGFSIEILAKCSVEKLSEREGYYIKKLQPTLNVCICLFDISKPSKSAA